MFSGGDSSGEGINQFGNFRLLSQNSSGVGVGSIDWASLAAQWIQMQDSSSTPLSAGIGVVLMPEAPPPPSISYHHVPKAMEQASQPCNTRSTTSTAIKLPTYAEKGEADMDMDDDDDGKDATVDNGRRSPGSSPPPPAPSMNLPDVTDIMQPPHWYMQQQMQMSAPVAIPAVDLGNSAATSWNAWPPRVTVPPPTNVVSTTPILQVPTTSKNSNRTAHIPSLMKLNVPNPNNIKSIPTVPAEADAEVGNATMDAAKRKVLPAWIREGLEKMEREKQKELERQQQQQQFNANPLDPNEAEQATLPLLANELTVKHNTAKALESDSSGNEDAQYEDSNIIIGKALVKAADAATSGDDADIDAADADADAEEQHMGKSYELKLADLMIVVRRTLTELLLEVTNDEISNVAQEAIKSCKRKASSAQVIRKSALSSITGKLGLAAYANTSSDDESSNSENDQSADNDNEADSEEELKVMIRQKRRNFTKVAEEIDERIASCAQSEEQKLKHYTQIEQQRQQEADSKREAERALGDADATNSNSVGRHTSTSDAVGKGYEREFGETTTETKLHSNGKRLKVERPTRKERITRFSDNKDSKSTSMAYITQVQQQQQQQQQHQQPANLLQLPTTLFPIGSATVTAATVDADNDLYAAFSGHGKSISKVVSAAEAAFEKAAKRNKSSSSSTHRRHKGRRHSSDNSSSRSSSSPTSSSTSTDSNSSESGSSRHAKHKRSRKKHDKRSDSRSYRSSSHQQKHAASSSSSRNRSERDQYADHRRRRHDERRHRRRRNSESDDYHQSSRARSRSRSRSSYASSSSRRRRR